MLIGQGDLVSSVISMNPPYVSWWKGFFNQWEHESLEQWFEQIKFGETSKDNKFGVLDN